MVEFLENLLKDIFEFLCLRIATMPDIVLIFRFRIVVILPRFARFIHRSALVVNIFPDEHSALVPLPIEPLNDAARLHILRAFSLLFLHVRVRYDLLSKIQWISHLPMNFETSHLDDPKTSKLKILMLLNLGQKFKKHTYRLWSFLEVLFFFRCKILGKMKQVVLI